MNLQINSGQSRARGFNIEVRRKLVLLASALMVGAIFVPVSAHAKPNLVEGSLVSYLNRVPNNFETRRWTDRYYTSRATASSLQGCTRVGGNMSILWVELRRHRTALPDVSRGSNNFGSCRANNGSHWRSWGVQTVVGTYFQKIDHRSTSLTVNRYATEW